MAGMRDTVPGGRRQSRFPQASRACRIRHYQKRGLNEQLEDMKKDFGMLVPFIRLVRPFATWFVTRSRLTSRRTSVPVLVWIWRIVP
jgi:hypothetical protein